MEFTIRQVGNQCQIVAADGTVVGTFDAAVGRTAYEVALAALGGIIGAQLLEAQPLATVTGEEGLLPEWWESDEGIAFSVETPGGRDFSGCEWSWRDPAASLLPVMFQTQNLPAHMEAQLAGFVVELSGGGVGSVAARGRFYDSDVGRAARDTLLGGRRFGVSVDPTENVTWDESFECIAWDEEGFCVDGNFSMTFHTYEIGGFTMEPHPCFENASVVLADQPAAIAASADRLRRGMAPSLTVARGGIDAAGQSSTQLAIPTAPPVEWLRLPEPRPGVPFLGDLTGDDVLVPQWTDVTGQVQEIAGYAAPLTISPEGLEGLVYGHLTWWGQCHVGDPWGPGVCASASPSRNGYRDFLTGHVVCSDGTDVPTGELVVGCEHSAAMDAAGVRDHLAHAGMGWASVTISDGEFGPWLTGVLRPDLTDAQVRLLRALSLSGEWVGELAGVLSVNTPGLPVQRLAAAAAFPQWPGWGPVSVADAAARPFTIPQPALRASARGGVLTKLIGGNIVRRCPKCEERHLARRLAHTDDVLGELRAMRQLVEHLERRTRHLVDPEAAAILHRLTPPS